MNKQRVQGSTSPGVPLKARRGAIRLAWSLSALALGLLALALLMVLLGWSRPLPEGFYPQWEGHLVTIIGAVGPPILGGLIASRRPDSPYGWLWVSFGLALALLLLVQSYVAYAVANVEAVPMLGVVLAVGGVGWLAGYAAIPPFLMLLFPDGRLPSQRWRFVAWTAVAAALISLLTVPFLPGESGIVSVENPLGAKGALGKALEILSIAGVLTIFGCALLSALSLIFRYRRAGRVQRQQIKWFVYAAAAFGGMLVFTGFLGQELPGVWHSLLETAVLTGLYAAIGIAILRYRLYDIDLIINRTLVYAGLTASVVGVYVLVVGYLGTLLQTSNDLVVSLAATGIVAILFQPLRERLQHAVNRLMYGERDEPYVVLSRLGQRLEDSLSPDTVLPTVVLTVREALKLPYAAISLHQGGELNVVAESGAPAQQIQHVPLVYQGEPVGDLLLGARPGEDTFGDADTRLLNDLARQAGIAAHGVRLTIDLQRSRERLVNAREEERRRLRRDLHDGLGPQLASQSLTIDAAIRLLEDDPQAAAKLLRELKAQSQEAVADIRRLVYDLRPPALDDLGLIGALQAQADAFLYTGLEISITAPQPVPSLPAAVEVACYRIVQEALANTVRHAKARHCRVSLSVVDATLSLEIRDDGVGLTAGSQAGVGRQSMRERAAELGGSCHVRACDQGGTCVTARLPLPLEER